jgi:hypothetical protein
MKSCVVFGDLSSDRTSENYPTVQVCDECIEAEQKELEAIAKHNNEHSQDEGFQEVDTNERIVQICDFDPLWGNKCEFCDKTLEEEAEES